jgi:hypothetical protein
VAAISHVFTISRVAEMLGEDEGWLNEISVELDPEDGCLVTDAIRIHDTNPRREPRYMQAIRNLVSHRVTKGERILD